MFDVDITHLVPRFIIDDENGYAVAKAIEAGLNALNKTIEAGVGCVVDPDKMPEWRLDEMAWETNCLYDYKADIEVKRKWVRQALPMYRIYGTKAAVQEILLSAYGQGEVIERSDDPTLAAFEFDIKTDGQTDEHTFANMVKMVNKSKNVRSHLHHITFKIVCNFDITELYIIKERKKYSTKEIPKDIIDIDILTDENGNVLTTETGAFLTN